MCKCVLYYCHRVTTQLQLTNITYQLAIQCFSAAPMISRTVLYVTSYVRCLCCWNLIVIYCSKVIFTEFPRQKWLKYCPPFNFLLHETFRKMALFSTSRDWVRYESVCVEVFGGGIPRSSYVTN